MDLRPEQVENPVLHELQAMLYRTRHVQVERVRTASHGDGSPLAIKDDYAQGLSSHEKCCEVYTRKTYSVYTIFSAHPSRKELYVPVISTETRDRDLLEGLALWSTPLYRLETYGWQARPNFS